MISCRYCLEPLTEKENNMFYCLNCETFFPLSKTSKNGERQNQMIHDLPIFSGELEKLRFKEIKELPTLQLYYWLSIARKQQFISRESGDNWEKMWKLKRLQIENILLERLGYYPKTISKEFLKEERSKVLACLKFPQY